MPYIKGAVTINEDITCSFFSLKINVEMNTPIIIPTPAPRPENENLVPPSVMETAAIQEHAIVHKIVSIQVRTIVCHEIFDFRINITALQNPIRTDKTIINPYGDQVKTGISICILEMMYAFSTVVVAVHSKRNHHNSTYDHRYN